jgi:hypothetical protein
MPTFKISDFESKAEKHANKTPPGTWNKYDGKRNVDYGQIEADRARPTLLSDPAAWWAALDDSQKLEAIETLGEFAGGTVGAVAGGGTPASIPAAGGGAIAGKGIARGVGRAMGLKPKPSSVRDELIDTAKTFALNAGGETVGLGAALFKPLMKRGLQTAIKADPHIAQLAESAGVALTPGMLSQRPLVRQAEAVLENTPGGMGTIRAKTNEAVKATEANLRKIPEKLHPTPVDRPEAAETLRSQLKANQQAVHERFNPEYEAQVAKAGDAPIDVGQFQEVGAKFYDELPPQFHPYFDTGTLAKLKAASSMMAGQQTKQGFIDTGVPTLTFAEAQKLRTSLLRAERNMQGGDTAVTKQAIPALRNALDRSIDDSLSMSTNPVHRQVLPEWRKTNAEYAKEIQKVGRSGDRGNATAEVIGKANDLTQDNLVTRIANSPSAVREAEIATTPMFGASDENAMGKLRRNRADAIIESSKTKHPWSPDEKIVNPDTLERNLAARDGTEELLSPINLELQDNIRLGKAVLGPSGQRNTSNTARFNQALGLTSAAGGAAYGAIAGDGDALERGGKALAGAALGGVAAPFGIAKVATWPRFVKSLTKPPGPLKAPISGPLLGAASRGIMDMQRLPEAPVSLEQAEDAPPKVVRFKVGDFQ